MLINIINNETTRESVAATLEHASGVIITEGATAEAVSAIPEHVKVVGIHAGASAEAVSAIQEHVKVVGIDAGASVEAVNAIPGHVQSFISFGRGHSGELIQAIQQRRMDLISTPIEIQNHPGHKDKNCDCMTIYLWIRKYVRGWIKAKNDHVRPVSLSRLEDELTKFEKSHLGGKSLYDCYLYLYRRWAAAIGFYEKYHSYSPPHYWSEEEQGAFLTWLKIPEDEQRLYYEHSKAYVQRRIEKEHPYSELCSQVRNDSSPLSSSLAVSASPLPATTESGMDVLIDALDESSSLSDNDEKQLSTLIDYANCLINDSDATLIEKHNTKDNLIKLSERLKEKYPYSKELVDSKIDRTLGALYRNISAHKRKRNFEELDTNPRFIGAARTGVSTFFSSTSTPDKRKRNFDEQDANPRATGAARTGVSTFLSSASTPVIETIDLTKGKERVIRL